MVTDSNPIGDYFHYFEGWYNVSIDELQPIFIVFSEIYVIVFYCKLLLNFRHF